MSEEKKSHSEIGASSYHRWSAKHGGCPGSVRMSRGCENIESEYAKDGTLAHLCASQILEKHFYKTEPAGGWATFKDEEMKDAVETYVEYVIKRSKRVGTQVFIEHGFDLSEVYPGAFGTADAVIYIPQELRIIVIDYKNGAGIAVEVEDNLQAQYYALGAMLSMKVPVETVEIVIVQPRCDHEDGVIRSWEFPAYQILDFAADLAEDAAATAKEDAPLVPGPKNCRFCPAAALKCPAVVEQARALAKIQFAPELSYDPEKLAQAMAFLPTAEAWIKQVRKFAYDEATHGRMPPGFKFVAKRATRKWSKEPAEVIKYMSDATKRPAIDFYADPKLKTPAQMEKLVSKQVGEGLREMIVSVSSGMNLVPLSDPRPEAVLKPGEVFTAIEGDE